MKFQAGGWALSPKLEGGNYGQFSPGAFGQHCSSDARWPYWRSFPVAAPGGKHVAYPLISWVCSWTDGGPLWSLPHFVFTFVANVIKNISERIMPQVCGLTPDGRPTIRETPYTSCYYERRDQTKTFVDAFRARRLRCNSIFYFPEHRGCNS